MKLLFICLSLLVSSVHSKAILNCFTGGFAYNKLQVSKSGESLVFQTEGIGLGHRFSKLSDQDDIQSVQFAVPATDCRLNRGIICSSNRVRFVIDSYHQNKGQRRIQTDHQHVSILLKRVSNQYTGIKLIVLTSTGTETALLTNGLKTCSKLTN